MELPVATMSVEDKLDVLEQVWESLRETPEAVPVPDWQRRVLDERDARLRSGEAELIPWEEVKADLDELDR